MFFLKKKSEGPSNIKKFLEKTHKLNWGKEHNSASIEALFSEATQLISYEIKYYYDASRKIRTVSFLLRLGMVASGGGGVLIPLLHTAGKVSSADLGYVFLATAGIFVAANRLFGGTMSHIRYISTQLRLEKLVAETVVKWNGLKSSWKDANPTDEELNATFVFVSEFLQSAYNLILTETEKWGETLSKALDDYAKKITSKNK